MILSHLSTRDLTRSLVVSKHWHDTILNPKSKSLRRILFLEPAKARDHLEYTTKADSRYYEDTDKHASPYKPILVREPNQNSRPIVEIHPLLLLEATLKVKLFFLQGPRTVD